MDERVAFVREHARERIDRLEFDMLVQDVVITTDPETELRRRKDTVPQLDLTVTELAHAPQLLMGTVTELAETPRRRRDRYGLSYVTVHEPAMERFAEVMRELHGE
jgi:hypothetical protein